jgi:hypothetical protein
MATKLELVYKFNKYGYLYFLVKALLIKAFRSGGAYRI